MVKEPSKKRLAVIAAAIGIGVIGGALAYFQTSDPLENVFNVAEYSPTIVEHFESPSDWTPGTTTEKTVEVTNNGSIPMAVRVKYTEKWADAEGTALPLTLESGESVAIINFNDDNTWKKVGDYYYYVGTVAPEAKTTSFIESVTFNKDVALNSTSKTTENVDTNENGVNDKTTITYTISDFNNATYNLDIVVETIQADQANTVWGVDVNNLSA